MQTQLPLSALRFGHDANVIVNARVAGRKDGIETLAANIHARGLIEPLIVKQDAQADEGVMSYLVSDGNRRLAALHMIFGESSDEPIECMVRDVDDAGAFEDSLTAAVLAHQLHPVDQYEAFARLETDGTSIEEIARRFGMTEKQVRQALALGRLSPKIRNAWRAGNLNAEAAEAFTLALDHKTQDQAFDKLSAANKLWRTYVVEELGASDRDVSKLIAFAGDLYRGAGGKLIEDLFGPSHVVSDPALLKRLAQEKLAATCEQLRSEGWSWAQLASELPSGARWWPKSEPKTMVYEGDEKERLTTLRGQLEFEENQDDGGDDEKMEGLHDQIDKIEAAVLHRSFSERQKAKSGCIVDVESGELVILFGIQKPAEANDPKQGDRAVSASSSSGDKPSEPAEPSVSQALTHRLTLQLTKAAGAALVEDPDLALSVLLTGIAVYAGCGLNISVNGLEAGRLDLVGSKEVPSALALVRQLDMSQRMALVAEVAAAALDFQNQPLNSDRPETQHGPMAICNAIDPKTLNAALRGAFDATDYFNSVSKAVTLAAIAEAMGQDFARNREQSPKADIAAFAIANVPQTGWLPPQLRARGYDGPPVKAVTPALATDKRPKKAAASRPATAKRSAAKASPKKSKAIKSKPTSAAKAKTKKKAKR